MRQKILPMIAVVLLLQTGLSGQGAVASASVPTSDGSSTTIGTYLDPTSVDFRLILPAPPAQGSRVTAAELTELHHAESVRNPAEIAQAQAAEEIMRSGWKRLRRTRT